MHWIYALALTLLAGATPPPPKVVEPKEIKSEKGLKPDEGVVRLSVRSQRQYIETAYLYFVEVRPDGADGDRVLRFERGAGVPLMGSNMIDVKAKYYRVPEGKYRLLAYTVACSGVPGPGAVCVHGGSALPTGSFGQEAPSFEVARGGLTDAGDFVIEYIKEVDLDTADLFDDRYADDGYGVRWRAIKSGIRPEFGTLATGPAPAVPPRFLSRIECEQRPSNKKVQFPFRCPAASAVR